MHTQNVDRILNGKRNVLVLFYDFRCPDCRDFVEVYREAFAKHPLNVYFASVNAARYETLRVWICLPLIYYFSIILFIHSSMEIKHVFGSYLIASLQCYRTS